MKASHLSCPMLGSADFPSWDPCPHRENAAPCLKLSLESRASVTIYFFCNCIFHEVNIFNILDSSFYARDFLMSTYIVSLLLWAFCTTANEQIRNYPFINSIFHNIHMVVFVQTLLVSNITLDTHSRRHVDFCN